MPVLLGMLWAITLCQGMCIIHEPGWSGQSTWVRGCVGGKLDISFSHTVHNLDLSRNELTSLSAANFRGLDDLEILDLSNNNLTVLSVYVFYGLWKLEMLDLSHNALTVLQERVFHWSSKLETLDLSDNALTVLPERVFHQLSTLERLWLSNNALTVLPECVFHWISKLEMLDLSHNALTVLRERVFHWLSTLERLDLSHNALTVLPEGVFHSLSNLHTLILSSNKFERIPCCVMKVAEELSSLYLDIHSNAPLPQPWCAIVHAHMLDRGQRSCADTSPFVTCARQIKCKQDAVFQNECSAKCVPLSVVDSTTNCFMVDHTISFLCGEYICPVDCQWSEWSEWTNHCEGECGLATATKTRLRYIELPQVNGSPCEGASVEAVSCNFSACNATMHCDGSLLTSPFTREIFTKRRQTCHEQCRNKCTVQDLCADAPIHRREAWVDPKWTQRWFETTLNKFMVEVALGDSFEHPTAASKYQPCLWLLPTCANASDCEFGAPFNKPTVRRIMGNFYHWHFSAGEINARRKAVGERAKFRIGGKEMASEDKKDPTRGRCVERCSSWCYESCSCNWGWEFPWANEVDVGWLYGAPMRYRWIPSAPRNPSYGTWKCVRSDGEPLRTPWDKPTWSMDIYAEKVKRMYAHFAPLQFHLVCDHVKVYYARQVCGTKTNWSLNCTRAAQPVVDYLYEHGMLQPDYMQKGGSGKKHRATLAKQLHADIHSSCRRTCAASHTPAFLHLYPDY